MCGIAGIVEKESVADKSLLSGMLRQIAHRGPESEGVWFGNSGRVALGHRRLAIIDLSPGGHQPMVAPDGGCAVTFNGEIYNYLELKSELSELGWTFRTQSDTEVLLFSYMQWGEKCVEKLNGMFAFAVWDEKSKTLFAARDRLGEKPFKYYADNGRFVFASEIKAVLEDISIGREVDWQAVDMALSFRCVGAPRTGFKNIHKLPAGHFLIWKDGVLKIKQYWDAGSADVNGIKTVAEWKKEIWDLFKDSVKKRMISDVPLGAFLSGGIDSTSVVAAMSEISERPVETFVISIGGKSEDQKYAALAAKYFNTKHREIALEDIDYAGSLEKLSHHYDEPFFDQSALPSMLISEQMKKHVTVVLSGDGGDELFGGYDAYKYIRFLSRYQRLPAFVYRKLVPLLLGFSQSAAYRAEVLAKDFFSAYTEYYSLWKKSLPLSKKYFTKEDLYLPEFRKGIDFSGAEKQMKEWFADTNREVVNSAMLADIRGRLADGYLTKTDIATMASAVELRPPFLDYRLVELSQKIPGGLKVKGGITKWLWKEVVKEKIPQEIISRPKAGFSIPLHLIIKTKLKDLVEENVLSEKTVISSVFSRDIILNMWKDHLNGKADYSNHIWSLLMLELWLKKYGGK